MGTPAVATIPGPPIAAPVPNRGLTGLPSVVLQKILAFVDTLTPTLSLAATSKDVKRATEALIKIDWCRFNLNLLPNIQKALASQNLSAFRNPQSCRDLQTIYNGLQQQYTLEGNTFLATRARDLLKRSFNPSRLQELEDVAKQESNRNLELIWPKIVEVLPPELNLPLAMNSAQIKHWLNTNSNRLAEISILNLSGLNLTMIPEEFSSLNLPNLTHLFLFSNSLSTLPDNFGSNWPKLRGLYLHHNQISALPADFGSNWIRLESLDLANNQISALPADFSSNCPQLQKLNLGYNQLSALPADFGSNWPQLQTLNLGVNQISALPPKFGVNWNWCDQQRRNESLFLNPILDSISRVQPTPPPIVPHTPLASPYQKPQKLEDAVKQESNRNLELIWPRIVRKLPPELNLRLDMNSAQIKHWLKNNSDQLAEIGDLNLSSLNLTMIPEEFSSLNLPNLTYLGLDSNRLTTLPDNFGSKWIRLQYLFLFSNQLRALPADFGSNWIQLQELDLILNQISALPPKFGANWDWWGQRRNRYLTGNPILKIPSDQPILPLPAIAAPPAPVIAPRTPPASSYQKLQKTLTSRATAHVLSTIALTAIASYTIGWKLSGTIGAIYLTHRFIKGYL